MRCFFEIFSVGLFFIAVDALAEDEKPLVQIFRRKIEEQIDGRHQILVPSQVLREEIAQQGGKRSKHGVKSQHLQHGDGNIGGRLEGKLPVQGEIPHHRQNQSDQLAGPVTPAGQLVMQGKGAHFDRAGADGAKCKFYDTPKFFHRDLSFLNVKAEVAPGDLWLREWVTGRKISFKIKMDFSEKMW